MQESNQPHPWARRIRIHPLAGFISIIAVLGVVATVVFALRGGTPRGTTPQSSALTSRTVFITAMSSPVGVRGYTGLPTSLTLKALTSDTGKVLWQHSEAWSAHHLPFAAVVVPGVIYMVGDVNISAAVAHPGSSILLALRASDGSQLWGLDVGAWASQPVVDSNTIYISAQQVAGARAFSKVVYAVNAHDGSVRWQTVLPHTGIATDSLTLNQGRLFLGASEYACAIPCVRADLFALDTRDGHLLWHQPLPGVPDTAAAPAVDSGVVYYPGPGPQAVGPLLPSSVFAYSVRDGHALWRHVSPIGSLAYGFVVAGGTAYTAEFVGTDPARSSEGIYSIVARDGATGTQQWRVPITPTQPVVSLQVLAIQDGRLYVESVAQRVIGDAISDDETITALDPASGRILWEEPLGPAEVSLLLGAGVVYVSQPPAKAPGQVAIWALNGSDGSQRWKAPVDASLRAYYAPTLTVTSGGLLFFETYDDTHEYTYAARASDGQARWRITRPNVSISHRLTIMLGMITT